MKRQIQRSIATNSTGCVLQSLTAWVLPRNLCRCGAGSCDSAVHAQESASLLSSHIGPTGAYLIACRTLSFAQLLGAGHKRSDAVIRAHSGGQRTTWQGNVYQGAEVHAQRLGADLNSDCLILNQYYEPLRHEADCHEAAKAMGGCHGKPK